MTLTTFAKKLNLSVDDMIEVLKCMGYFKQDYSDWTDELYKNKVVSDLNTIVNTRRLRNDIVDYKNLLTDYYVSRFSKTNNDIKKIMIKDKIYHNEALLKFIRS